MFTTLTRFLTPLLIEASRFPSTLELKELENASESFGRTACAQDSGSQLCLDYESYYQKSENIEYTPLVHAKDFGKLLIVSVGATFRSGGNADTTIGEDHTLKSQKGATMSHRAFGRYVEGRFGVKTDFVVRTYNTTHLPDLKSWYPPGTIFSLGTMNKSLKANKAYEVLLTDAIEDASGKLNFEEYGAVLFIRADLELKHAFFHHFQLPEKVTFLFAILYPQSSMVHLASNDRPHVCDMFLYIPQRFFAQYLWRTQGIKLFEEWAYNWYHGDDIGFFINTFHGTNSAHNPQAYYRMAGREEGHSDIDTKLTLANAKELGMVLDNDPDWLRD